MFTVEESKLLSQEKEEKFHDTVADLLCVYKRFRDTDLAVTFLCTIISCITDGDQDRIRRLLHHLQSTLDLPMVIGERGLDMLQPWVDELYAANHSMRGYTGGVMSMGQGIIHIKLSMQK